MDFFKETGLVGSAKLAKNFLVFLFHALKRAEELVQENVILNIYKLLHTKPVKNTMLGKADLRSPNRVINILEIRDLSIVL